MSTTDPTWQTGAPYDSRPATLLHSLRVGTLMGQIITELVARSTQHDLSKVDDPEVAYFDVGTPKLHTLTYGTPAYMASLAELGPALEHHYKVNRHHPEHHRHGIHDMTLQDLVEMLADWKASTERMTNGDLRASIQTNQDRFRYGDGIKTLLLNTAEFLGWIPPLDQAGPAGEGEPA